MMAILDGADVRTVQTPHGEVRVRDTGGDGPSVLLVHSLLLDPDLYATVTPLLTARGYRCVIPELPLGGHAVPLRSGADLTPPGLALLLVEVLDALGIAQTHIVGVDTGGALTQIMMARHRSRVGAVVLTACDAYDQFPPTTPIGLLFRPLFAPGVLELAAQLMRLAPARRILLMQPITHRGVDDDMLARWTGSLRNRGVRRDVRAAFAGMKPEYTLTAALANQDFPRPILIAWGDDDRLFKRRLAERLRDDLPHARLVTLADCAAFAAIDQPQLLAELIDEHLRDLTLPMS